jgi:hypothetical protein
MRTFRRLRLAIMLAVKCVTVLVHLHRWLQQSESGRAFERRIVEGFSTTARRARGLGRRLRRRLAVLRDPRRS